MTVSLSDQILAKAERLLLDDRVRVNLRPSGTVATVRGDTGTWTIGRRTDGSYYCSCPAFGMCSHLVAVAMIADVGGEAGA